MIAQPIDDYLSDLRHMLDGSPRDNERLLSEVEAHLRDAVATAEAEGLSPWAAAQGASFALDPPGTPPPLPARERGGPPSPFVSQRTCSSSARSCSLSSVYGMLGGPISWLSGTDFFFGDERTVPVTPERCARLLRLQPGQSTCNGALVEHHFEEYIEHGWTALALGVLLLWAVRVWRFRFEPIGLQRSVLEFAGMLAAVVQFSLLAAVKLPQGIVGAVRNPNLGAGRALSEGLVGATAAGIFLVVAVRQARQRRISTEGAI